MGHADKEECNKPWKHLNVFGCFLPEIERFKGFFQEHGIETVVAPVEERLEEAELLDLVSDIDGIVCGDDRITERVLDAAPRLKVIAKWGTGIDSIDSAAATARNITVVEWIGGDSFNTTYATI